MVISERIKRLRKTARLTQSDLASRVGVSMMTIRRWETGERFPDANVLPLLASELRTTVAYLLGETADSSRRMNETIHVYQDAEGRVHSDVTAARPAVESNVHIAPDAHMLRVRVLDKLYKLCCGSGNNWDSQTVEYEQTLWLPLSHLAARYGNEDVIAAYADGDSMAPKIQDGDLILFVPHEKEILYAGILMVVVYNGKMIIRGVVQNARKEIILKPYNTREHDDIRITPDDEFGICGRVVKILSLKDPEGVL